MLNPHCPVLRASNGAIRECLSACGYCTSTALFCWRGTLARPSSFCRSSRTVLCKTVSCVRGPLVSGGLRLMGGGGGTIRSAAVNSIPISFARLFVIYRPFFSSDFGFLLFFSIFFQFLTGHWFLYPTSHLSYTLEGCTILSCAAQQDTPNNTLHRIILTPDSKYSP